MNEAPDCEPQSLARLLPELSLIRAADEGVPALEPQAAVAAGVYTLLQEVASNDIAALSDDDPIKEAAVTVAVLGYRALRAVAVLAAAGLSSEALVHARRLGELVAICEKLMTSEAAEYAREWLHARKSPNKLLDREWNEALSRSAHAHVGHLRVASGEPGEAFPAAGRAAVADVLVPYGAAQLGHTLLVTVNGLVGTGCATAVVVDEVMLRWHAAAELAAAGG